MSNRNPVLVTGAMTNARSRCAARIRHQQRRSWCMFFFQTRLAETSLRLNAVAGAGMPVSSCTSSNRVGSAT